MWAWQHIRPCANQLSVVESGAVGAPMEIDTTATGASGPVQDSMLPAPTTERQATDVLMDIMLQDGVV